MNWDKMPAEDLFSIVGIILILMLLLTWSIITSLPLLDSWLSSLLP